MIFNTFFQWTLQAAFADETPIAHADHVVQPAAKRPKLVVVDAASALRIDTQMGPIVEPLPQTALASRPPTAVTISFLDLPSELFALIMTYLPTSDLLNLAQQFNDRLRAESTRAYLIRTRILHNHNVVYLTRDVPAIAVQLLSAVQLFEEVSLVCDLFYFVQYGRELCNFAMTKTSVRSLCINFHPQEKSLLGDRRTSSSLVAFLTIVNECCRTLTFQRQLRDPSYRKLTIARPTRRLCPLPAHITLPRLSALTISAVILGVPSLATTCHRLLQSPQVQTFQLDDCKTQQECNGVLAISTFPLLESIIIRTVDNTILCIEPAFFLRHAMVNTLSLYAYAIYDSATHPAAPRSRVPLPGLTHLNLTTNHYLWMLEDPDRLRRCYLQTPNSFAQPQSVEFCSNLNSLCTFASSLTQYHFKGLELSIQLPNSILCHVAHFQHSK
ncbi:uncharacterized protein LACBIDRAFT_323723 [Laccaria bicolor S238N-H82]|uniref:Predicted protein n=1 Tax=Laccaria bicolor (strain S238N-H82 / ATCC MYA-4686) TaxID=486041 RepID=B0CYK5_LACBS|nr:uncharacterized protein LACBIDRAFT_323723 [Laccaria bicolor S238N-H82]EDR12467.1 predicted protein [Laccaria bicolor S238N-H82]|eukprot:XP_001876731.1 predicted protein [Laccaria bicolor S238N-H82]